MRAILATILLLSAVLVSAQSKKASIPFADSLFFLQNWKKAIVIYEKVLKTEPTNSLAWNRLGISYHNLSNYDKALENYVKALNYKPAAGLEIIIQSRLARVYAIKNNPDNAFASLDKAIALGYSNLTELETQKEFDNLRKDQRFKDAWTRTNLNVYPCMGNAQARQFDFWIGEWDAYVTGTTILQASKLRWLPVVV